MPLVFIASAVLMIFIPEFASLPWIHLLTVALFWVKWRLAYRSPTDVARSNVKRPPGRKGVGRVDKGTVFSSEEDDSSGSESDEEVYYAARKQTDSRPKQNKDCGDDPIAEDVDDEKEEEEQEEAIASTWKRVNELLLIGELDLTSKLWTEDMDDWETVELVVRRYPRKLPVAGGLVVHRDTSVAIEPATEKEERVD